MVLVNTTKSAVNIEEVTQIVQNATMTSHQKVESLSKKFDNYVKNTNKFKRTLELEVSRIRETDNEIADRLDILLREWGEI